MENFASWIGKTEQQNDVSQPRSVAMMQAVLNKSAKDLAELPHLFHWLYFLPIVNNEHLSEDGHPTKGGFLPPIPFPKRMWAGGRLTFLKPIKVNQNIQRLSKISKIEFKQGKSGNMCFVTVTHSIYVEDELAIVEEQDIVYREASPAPIAQSATVATTAAKIETQIEVKAADYKKPFPIQTTTLFRYSALTFNSHKIHYDRPYSMQQEGYPGLVVHGPLLATLLINTFAEQHPNKQIESFEFRAVNPVFDFDDFHVCGQIIENHADLWIEKSSGLIAMKATVHFKN